MGYKNYQKAEKKKEGGKYIQNPFTGKSIRVGWDVFSDLDLKHKNKAKPPINLLNDKSIFNPKTTCRQKVWNQNINEKASRRLLSKCEYWCCYCSSVTQLCLTLCDPMDYSTAGLLSLTISWNMLKHPLSVLPSNHLALCHSLLLLLSIFPSISVFSNCIRWPKYWSFSFSINPSNEYSGLISFRIDWFELLAVPGNLKSLL